MDRVAVFRRDDFTCVYCGRDGTKDPEVRLSIDHVEPRMRGGDNSAGNVVTACVSCNRAKGGKAAWDYLSELAEERTRFLAKAPYVWPRLRAAIIEAAEKVTQ